MKKYKEVSNFKYVKCIGGIIVSAEPQQPIDAAKMSPKQISKGPPMLKYLSASHRQADKSVIWSLFYNELFVGNHIQSRY
jgi:hypothetical protein